MEVGGQAPQKHAEDRDPSDFGLYIGHLRSRRRNGGKKKTKGHARKQKSIFWNHKFRAETQLKENLVKHPCVTNGETASEKETDIKIINQFFLYFWLSSLLQATHRRSDFLKQMI